MSLKKSQTTNEEIQNQNSASSPVLEFKNVSFSYNETANVRNLNVKINKGDFIAIIGSNGAGKSTFSKLCNGLLQPSEGDVFVIGENTRRKKISELARNIGFLFQNPDRQICCNTVEEEIAFSLRNNGISESEVKRRVDEAVNHFGFDAKTEPFNMSRGQRQRLCLACLIALNPEILILDEPTTGLHFHDIKKLLASFDALIERGHTIVIIEHNMEIIKCADYVVDLGPEGGEAGGNIVACGTPEEIAKCKQSYTGKYLKKEKKLTL